MINKTPHVHAELIKAWADGVTIEVRHTGTSNQWIEAPHPSWSRDYDYRVKPEPKPDAIRYGIAKLDGIGSARVYYLGQFNSNLDKNIKLVFDGETGKLKSAEVIPKGNS